MTDPKLVQYGGVQYNTKFYIYSRGTRVRSMYRPCVDLMSYTILYVSAGYLI